MPEDYTFIHILAHAIATAICMPVMHLFMLLLLAPFAPIIIPLAYAFRYHGRSFDKKMMGYFKRDQRQKIWRKIKRALEKSMRRKETTYYIVGKRLDLFSDGTSEYWISTIRKEKK